MSIPFTLTRDQSGALQAHSAFPLGFERRELRVTTSRSMGGELVTRAICVQVSECGRLFTYAVGVAGRGDYGARLAAARVRATARAIEAQHARALADIGAQLAAAAAHYGRAPAAALN